MRGQEGRKSHQGFPHLLRQEVRGARLGISGDTELWKPFRLTMELGTDLHYEEHSGQPDTVHWRFALSVYSEGQALGQSTLAL